MFGRPNHKSKSRSGKVGGPLRRRRDSDENLASEEACEQGNDAEASGSVAISARRELLEQIQVFIMRHSLEITGSNLAMICDGLSGRDPALRRAFAQRELASGLVDQAWLDQLRPSQQQAQQRIDQMEDMMDLMENAMSEFHSTTQSARDATGAYREAVSERLEQPAADADQDDAAGRSEEEFQQLLILSRDMLGQLKSFEAEMERNQREAAQLRDNLAKARQEADIDHLTSLPNRRSFERKLKQAAANAAETAKPFTVAFCDIDHFKMVNDTHGHDAGDRVLKAVAAALGKIAGDGCFVARHGGEEFVLLFEGQTKEEAFERLEKTRIKLSHRRLMNRETGKPYGKITFSAGVAQVDEYDDPRAALAQADEALYEAKEGGRNRTEIAGS